MRKLTIYNFNVVKEVYGDRYDYAKSKWFYNSR